MRTAVERPTPSPLLSPRSLRLPAVLMLVGALACLPACSSDSDPAEASDSSGVDADAQGSETTGGETTGGETTGGETIGGETSQHDVPVVVEPATVFHFETMPGQSPSRAPFPNDLYRSANGVITVGSLADDPIIGQIARPEILARFDEVIPTRNGFGHTASVFFFMADAPDPATLDGKATIITLAGPEAGRVVAADVFAATATHAIGVRPAWGDYLMANSTYAVLLSPGIATTGGISATAPADWTALTGDAAPADASQSMLDARGAYAPLRQWFSDADESPSDYVVGTVFTTEDVMPLGRKLIAAVDAFALQPVRKDVGYDAEGGAFTQADPVEGAGLPEYFGTAWGGWENVPGPWDGHRDEVALLPGFDEAYTGGTVFKGIGRVVNGSIEAPAFHFEIVEGQAQSAGFRYEGDGLAEPPTALVPFTLFLCESHLADPSNVPVSIFNHGGGALRANAISNATLNCRSGMATVALDMVFHGGRVANMWVPEEELIVPVGPDAHNVFTGKSAGDEGFVPDYVGDGGSAALSVGAMYAGAASFDPDIIEATLLQITADTYTLVRYLQAGDWSVVAPGLSFDTSKLMHASLSFGTSFTTALHALVDDFSGVVQSVGAGSMLGTTLAMSPTNAVAASGIVRLTMDLKTEPKELIAGAYRDMPLSVLQWLSERGDPLTWAPYVLRHRSDGHQVSVVGSASSWDETLNVGSELTYAAAYGLPIFTAGPEWTLDPTVPGADLVQATPLGAMETLSGNATFGDRTHSAAIFHLQASCHSHSIAPVCANTYVHPYPPVETRESKIAFDSPVCAWQTQVKAFHDSLLGGADHATIGAPAGTCEELYGD